MRYRASFLAYAFCVHKNAMQKNWLMRVKDPQNLMQTTCSLYIVVLVIIIMLTLCFASLHIVAMIVRLVKHPLY